MTEESPNTFTSCYFNIGSAVYLVVKARETQSYPNEPALHFQQQTLL